jgi:copper(I)-binding protein
MNPGPALQIGAKVPVTLDFADGTKITTDFAVRNAAGK